ncbi:MAG: ATP-binding SpoIIE family protein phosphatase [Bacteroidota bacterium]
MDNQAHKSFLIQDRSYLSLYKKEIHKLATENGLGEKKTAEVDIIVAEMTSNLLKHTKGGELLVKLFADGPHMGLELLCIDNGPGMADPQKMMNDGVSTTNTLGQGLGAIKRLSDTFQLYSLKDWGTVLLSRVYKDELTARELTESSNKIRTVMVPKPGETLCGDGYAEKIGKDYWKVFAGDGLGHGPEANHAVKEAVTLFKNCPYNDPVEIVRTIHASVKRTRGLVGTVAVYSIKEKMWRMCGVGNVASFMVNSLVHKGYMSYNGVIGLNMPNTMNPQQVPHMHNQMLLMCSDGIKTRIDTTKYPAIMKYDPTVLAAAIYKDYARKTDDMLVLVSKVTQ